MAAKAVGAQDLKKPPVRITPELFEEICLRIEKGESVRGICQGDDMPSASKLVEYAGRTPETQERYARARNAGLDMLAEQAVQIADDLSEDPNSRRVRLDARKWFLSKLRPDKYGDLTRQEISGPGGAPVEVRTLIPSFSEPPKPE